MSPAPAETATVLVLTTVIGEGHPEALARVLVEERLAACVNLLPPMTSIYRWQGTVAQEQEHLLLIKTTRPRLDALRARLHALHPYEVPEFLVLAVAGGSERYLDWVRGSVE